MAVLVAELLQKSSKELGGKFPGAIFALYYFYWDCTHLTVITFSEKGLLGTHHANFENYKIGPYDACFSIDPMKFTVNGCLSSFISPDQYSYEFDFGYEESDNAT